MAFEVLYPGLGPLRGLVGVDRKVYWLRRDAQRLLQTRLATSSLRACQVMGMDGDPCEAATAPAAALYSTELLYARVLTHAQLTEAFQGASTDPVREFGVALNSRTVYVAHSILPRPHVPVLHMLQPHRVLRRMPSSLRDTTYIRVMDLESRAPVQWFAWVACFDAWVQEHVYGQ